MTRLRIQPIISWKRKLEANGFFTLTSLGHINPTMEMRNRHTDYSTNMGKQTTLHIIQPYIISLNTQFQLFSTQSQLQRCASILYRRDTYQREASQTICSQSISRYIDIDMGCITSRRQYHISLRIVYTIVDGTQSLADKFTSFFVLPKLNCLPSVPR